jgi:FMN phosphatase YigB (HAD superfamily)
LKTLISRKIPLALIRNSTLPLDEFQKTVEESGASDYFNVDKNIVLSGESGVFKPHKEIFEACLKKCNLMHLDPQRILFVGNETEADVVGMNSVRLVLT